MEDIKRVGKFFEGLIDFFFDPCQKDEFQESVLCLIQNSLMNKRLKRNLIPKDMMDSLCSGGWDYKDYGSQRSGVCCE